MAYDSLKSLIRQYIKTNGEQEITGQILQNVLVEMVNQYPSTDGYATQSWVTSQLAGYATTSQLAGYLPLTGGTLSGNLTVSNAYMSVVTADNSSTSYTTIIRGPGIEAQMMSSGTPIYRMVLDYSGLTFYNNDVAGTTITRSSITSGSFIKSGGTAAQFLKADGSVDSNTYVTSSALSGYLPLTGGTLTGDLFFSSNGINRGEIFGDEYGLNIQVSGQGKLLIENAIEADSTIKTSGFIKNGGTSAQFLKADGSVDSNTYITASALTGYATQSWVTTQLGDYLPLTGGTLTGDLYLTNGEKINIILIEGRRIVELNLGYSQISGTEYAWNMYIESALDVYAGLDMDGVFVGSGFKKIDGTSAQFLKADGSVDSTAYLPKQGSSFYFITDADMPETAANISTLNAAHRMTLYRNAILMPYMANDANDGGFIRSRGTSESSAIMEIGMWDDAGAGETIQFNYYPTTSTINPTYSVTVPKKSGTIALTSDLASYNPTSNFKTINNQSIIGTGNINIEGGGGTLYDAEIEYIEGTGTQWIDTGIIPNASTKVQFRFTNIEATGDVIIGYAGVNDADDWRFFNYNNQAYFDTYGGTGTGKRIYGGSIVPNTIYNLELGNYYVKNLDTGTNIISGSAYSGTGYGSIQVNGNGISPSQGGGSISKNRWYYVKIYDNNTLVFDAIPVRVGNVGYLYDKVSGELFGNSGTGSFVLGQDTGPGGGSPYLPLTGGTITGNLTVNGTVKFNSNLTFANDRGIDFGTDNTARIRRNNYNLLIVYEYYNDIIIGNYANDNYTSIVNDLQGGTTDANYSSVISKWSISVDGTAQFKSVSQTSDLRKKTIMGDVPINLYNVANAPLFKFTWNNEKKYSGQHIGSAAQYWQTVLPELVSIGRDADMTLAMQYDVIALASAITVAKTVVSHEERIILLERENEALKKEIADLKSA